MIKDQIPLFKVKGLFKGSSLSQLPNQLQSQSPSKSQLGVQ